MSTNRTFYKHKTEGTVMETFGSMPTEWQPISRAEGQRLQREQAREELRTMLTPGQTVYTQLRHVSASGMSRRISLCIVKDGRIVSIDWLAARAMDDKQHRDGGIVVSGCGMDMGFHLVYNLGACLWPHGTPAPHGTRNGQPDNTGGYALKHEWL